MTEDVTGLKNKNAELIREARKLKAQRNEARTELEDLKKHLVVRLILAFSKK